MKFSEISPPLSEYPQRNIKVTSEIINTVDMSRRPALQDCKWPECQCDELAVCVLPEK